MSTRGDFLEQMARSSHERLREALQTQSEATLLSEAQALPPPPSLRINPAGFDLIAEMKLRSPAVGQLKSVADEDIEARVTGYARAGAAAVSVLTEPSRFDGSMEHLERAAQALAPLRVPAMRKDFIVDPYQVIEARVAGAGGVLVILRMLQRQQVNALLDCARSLGLFVLLEAFDASDLEAMHGIVSDFLRGAAGSDTAADDRGSGAAGSDTAADGRGSGAAGSDTAARNRGSSAEHAGAPLLAGLNCRDLTTLQIIPERLVELAPLLPTSVPRVAESGVVTAEDAGRVARAGYSFALVGSALMQGANPGVLAAAMLEAGRRR
ncbi:MAG TPA: indole-3-glycerol-phosphate synthase [Steroidobacteraceae bacterium]|nr:indole-3-glycerol-phosphate synthase [Steroidobacteraceae bacterium]